MYFGIITSRRPVTTLESRAKVEHVSQIEPESEAQLFSLVPPGIHRHSLRKQLSSAASVVVLSPGLSGNLIEGLASIESNHEALRAAAWSFTSPRTYGGNLALQMDAVRVALKTFGLSLDAPAVELGLVDARETSLARAEIVEDGVIEHDARTMPGYSLVGSDVTGRAVFQKGGGRLEVFTANRRPLEKVFGVDLIYLNATRQNIVMVQYKMLKSDNGDWVYRPDGNLEDELNRMQVFRSGRPPGPHQYRFNPGVFYLKFVKRDGRINGMGIITPLDHFEKLCTDPTCRGPRGGLRVSYNSLSGRYLREDTFLDLIRSGYIGAHAETTADLETVVEAVLRGDRAVVAAIQQRLPSSLDPSL